MTANVPVLTRDALFNVTRGSWSLTARAFALPTLARALDAVSLPAFEPLSARIAHATPDYQLRHIPGTGEPILVVSSLINRSYVADLVPEHSYLAMLQTLGRPVYQIDWLPARGRDDRRFADFVAGPVRDAVEYVCAQHRVPALSLMGYSMGGTLATCFAARYPERVARLAILCAPIRFDRVGAFSRLVSPSLVHIDLLALWDKVPSRLINLPALVLDPMVKWRKVVELAKHVDDPRHLAYFLAVETWSHDSIDMPRGLVRSWIAELYQRNALVRGQLVVDGEPVSLAAIRCPTLAVTGKTDTLAPPACSEGLPDARLIVLDAGHIGVLTSRRALATQAPALATWLGERA